MKSSFYIISKNPNLEWLAQAWDSAQGLFDEYLLIDDCSDKPIPWATHRIKESHGIAFARNYAVKHCTGELICSLDDDDLLNREEVLKLKEFVELHPADIYHFPCLMFGTKTGLWGNQPDLSNLHNQNCISGNSWYTKKWWKKIGGYHGFCEDWSYWIKSLLWGAEFCYYPRAVYQHRMRQGSYSADMTGEKYQRIKSEIDLIVKEWG
jgi:glycosyltransferase involved in cell wall biosynthesis